jgi:hypothetical protein
VTAPPVQPTPDTGSEGEPTDGGDSTPGPRGSVTPAQTPGALQTPGSGDESELSPEEVQRLLDEALRGIDEEFTLDEALRVLGLLNRQNRGLLSQPQGDGGSGAPDY